MVMMEVMVWLAHHMRMNDVWVEMEEWRRMDKMMKGLFEYFE